jgi:hypothetical protein
MKKNLLVMAFSMVVMLMTEVNESFAISKNTIKAEILMPSDDDDRGD